MTTKSKAKIKALESRKTAVPANQNNGFTLNGKAAGDDHLAKANKAMKKAWILISQRKEDQE